jgi:deazaflavin-dependent oxidoreductase (nitroreductase family)
MTFNEKIIAEFRSSPGHVASLGDSPILLLTTIGAKSGQPRTTPMMYQPVEDDPNRVYVFASKAGSDQNPDWYHNILAHPDDLEVEIGEERLPATGSVVPEPRRAEIYATQASRFPVFVGYQEKTSRKIPVIALSLRR